jgi:hypothetical protein
MLSDIRLFDFTNSQYCGVLITEQVMKRLVKLESKYLHEVKLILNEELSNGAVFPSDWGLTYPKGVQTTYRYTSKNKDDAKHRIELATMQSKVVYQPIVFIASDYRAAQIQADEYYGVETKEEA